MAENFTSVPDRSPPSKKPPLDASSNYAHFDIQAFPHILDAVIEAASPEALCALRATSRELRDEIDRRQRHVSLQMDHEGPNPWAEGVTEEERILILERRRIEAETHGTRAPPLRGISNRGLRFTSPPPHMDVLDMSGEILLMWHDYARPDADWDDPALDERSDYGRGPWVREWVDENEGWYLAEPTLVRYLSGLDLDEEHDTPRVGPLRPDPCAVYFCDFPDFWFTLILLNEYYRPSPGEERPPLLDTVLNVTLDPGFMGTWSWYTLDPFEGMKLGTNAFTVLFNPTEEFEKSIEEEGYAPPFFGSLFEALVWNYGEGRGKATIVGYEKWPVGTLPDPSKRDSMGPVVNAADSVRRWVTIYGSEFVREWKWEEAEARRKDLEWDIVREPETPIRSDAEMADAIRLLTLDEWREEIGEEYFCLMTDPEYKYHSKQPLPRFNRHPSYEPLPKT